MKDKPKPTGNITFLFTDIEGSTKLSQNFPEQLAVSLDKHNSILTDAIESRNGFIFQIVGDSFAASFSDVNDAVNAACEIQRNLNNETWNEAKIIVRIGIHSGHAEWSGNRYLGYFTVARAHRVMSAAYGEQILISDNTFHLIGDNCSLKISFRDLGERRLKDLIQPIRLYQILSQGLREEFPPLKTLDARPNNLPIQLTNFIGRENEMKIIKNLLKQTHILTLTGTGGSGKTRLALQIAADMIDDFANGVWLIELASLSDAFLLPQTISKTLGVKEQPSLTAEETLIDFLKKKEMLIILDNCEHLIDEVAHLTEWMLSKITNLKIIATSREALRCSGEKTHKVLTLESPDPKIQLTLDKLLEYESISLFVERASSVNENFRLTDDNSKILSKICFQLDGIPLAIELAAARTKAISLDQIYERLNDRFILLTGGKRTSLPRQKTLRATIDWSYDLLSEKERILWKRLSFFSGGWTLEAAEDICSFEILCKHDILDLLDYLTEKSIIIFDTKSSRYRLLETIRQYGHEKLTESKEIEVISEKHLFHFSKLAQTIDATLKGHKIIESLEVLDNESSNISKALEWSSENPFTIEKAKLTLAMGYYWTIRGQISEGLSRLESALQKITKADSEIYYKLVSASGILYRIKCDYKKATKSFQDSLNYFRNIEKSLLISDLLNNLGIISGEQGEYSEAQRLHEEGLLVAREIDDRRGIANSLNNLGNIYHFQNNKKKALELHEESLTIRRETGDIKGIASSLLNLGTINRELGKYHKAEMLYEESLNNFRAIGDKRGIAICLNYLGNLQIHKGNYLIALNLIEESLVISREIDDKQCLVTSLNNLSKIFFETDEISKAKALNAEAQSVSRESGRKQENAVSLYISGKIFFKEGNIEEARKNLIESLEIADLIGAKIECVYIILTLTKVQIIQKDFTSATMLGFLGNYCIKNNLKLPESEQRVFNELMSVLSEKITEEKRLKCFEEGKAFTFDQAVKIALKMKL